jgi:uncharacterized protein
MTVLTLLYNAVLLGSLVAGILRARRRKPGERLPPLRQGLILLCGVAAVGAAVVPLGGFARFQLLAWAAFLHGPLYLIAAATLLRRRRILAAGALTLATLAWAIGVDAFVIEPRWLEVTRIEIPTDKVDAPLRIAVLADIQTDAPGDWEREVLERVVAESPDLVLFAGDYVQHGDHAAYAASVTRLNAILRESGLDPPLGMVAVRGNVDHRGWERIFEGTGAVAQGGRQVLDLGPVTVTALSLAEAFDGTEIDPADDFHVVLGHAPDFALEHPPADLMVAGHTHGGQVRLPFLGPIFTLSRVPRDWAAGATEVSPGSTLVVSRGIGMERDEAPRLRFLCRPELVIIDLIPAPGS